MSDLAVASSSLRDALAFAGKAKNPLWNRPPTMCIPLCFMGSLHRRISRICAGGGVTEHKHKLRSKRQKKDCEGRKYLRERPEDRKVALHSGFTGPIAGQ